MTFEWIGIAKDAKRPWKGLPLNRALTSGDLSWFKFSSVPTSTRYGLRTEILAPHGLGMTQHRDTLVKRLMR